MYTQINSSSSLNIPLSYRSLKTILHLIYLGNYVLFKSLFYSVSPIWNMNNMKYYKLLFSKNADDFSL